MKHIQFHLIWIWIYFGLKKTPDPFNYHSLEFAVWRRKNIEFSDEDIQDIMKKTLSNKGEAS